MPPRSPSIGSDCLDSRSWRTISEGLEAAGSARNLKEFFKKAVEAAKRLVPNDSGTGCFSFERGLLRWLSGDPESVGEGFNEKYRYMMSTDELFHGYIESGCVLDLEKLESREYVRDHFYKHGVRYSLGALDGDFHLCIFRSNSRTPYSTAEAVGLRVMRLHMSTIYHWIRKAERALLRTASRAEDHRAARLLTIRELEVLDCLERRMSAKEIGIALTMSPRTAERHTANIYDKLGVAARSQLVAALEASRFSGEGTCAERPAVPGSRRLLGTR